MAVAKPTVLKHRKLKSVAAISC